MRKFNFYLFISLSFICSLFSCSLKTESDLKTEVFKSKKNKFPDFLLYGELAPLNYIDVRDTLLTKKFGFTLKRIDGCEVTKELVDSIEIYNRKTNSIIEKKSGRNWKENFEKETKKKISIPGI